MQTAEYTVHLEVRLGTVGDPLPWEVVADTLRSRVRNLRAFGRGSARVVIDEVRIDTAEDSDG